MIYGGAINPMEAKLGPQRKSREGLCKMPNCNEPQADGMVVCGKHQQKAERQFYAQIGLDPLFHLKHDESTLGDWSWIYFVGSREHGMVKIGRTARLKHRMSSLRNSAPVPIKLFAVVFADPSLESCLHKRFEASRMHGEWFQISDEINQCIEDIKAQRFAEWVPEGMIPTTAERVERAVESMVGSVFAEGQLRETLDKLAVDLLRENC